MVSDEFFKRNESGRVNQTCEHVFKAHRVVEDSDDVIWLKLLRHTDSGIAVTRRRSLERTAIATVKMVFSTPDANSLQSCFWLIAVGL